MIENFDGRSIPEPEFLTDTTDLSRNFPWDWAPEPEQTGAGAIPGRSPSRGRCWSGPAAIPSSTPGSTCTPAAGVFIRPLGHDRDTRMNRGDRGLYRQLGAWGEELVGYPTVSGYEEFTYEPEKPLHGDLTDYAYNQRGCLALVCEIWDLFHQAGLPEPRPFVHRYTALSRDDMRKLADWDREENQGRVFQLWRRFDHPSSAKWRSAGPTRVSVCTIRRSSGCPGSARGLAPTGCASLPFFHGWWWRIPRASTPAGTCAVSPSPSTIRATCPRGAWIPRAAGPGTRRCTPRSRPRAASWWMAARRGARSATCAAGGAGSRGAGVKAAASRS